MAIVNDSDSLAQVVRAEIVSRAIIEGSTLIAGIFGESEMSVSESVIVLKWSKRRLFSAVPRGINGDLNAFMRAIRMPYSVVVQEID